MQAILNIGLDNAPIAGESFTNGVRNPEVATRMLTAVQNARHAGFKITAAKLVQSDTEPTLVLTITDDDPGLDNRIDMLATTLKQDCIAVWYPGEQWGQLIGPKAAEWGNFNPAFFFMPDGKRLG